MDELNLSDFFARFGLIKLPTSNMLNSYKCWIASNRSPTFPTTALTQTIDKKMREEKDDFIYDLLRLTTLSLEIGKAF